MPKFLISALQRVDQSQLDKFAKQQGKKTNELQLFVSNNFSALNNMLVYLFWIVISAVFTEKDQISFPVEFIDEVRQELRDQYHKTYFNYILRLKPFIADQIQEIFPFALAETVRIAIKSKLKNHDMPFEQRKSQVLLTSIVFQELFGYQTSQTCIEAGCEKFLERPTAANKYGKSADRTAKLKLKKTNQDPYRTSTIQQNVAKLSKPPLQSIVEVETSQVPQLDFNAPKLKGLQRWASS